jgi:hypothetical protein
MQPRGEKVAVVALFPHRSYQMTGPKPRVTHQDEMGVGFSQRVIAIHSGEGVSEQLLRTNEPGPGRMPGFILTSCPHINEYRTLSESVQDVREVKAALGHPMIHQQVTQSHGCTV